MYNIRILYPNDKIWLVLVDVKAFYCYPHNHLDLVGISSFIFPLMNIFFGAQQWAWVMQPVPIHGNGFTAQSLPWQISSVLCYPMTSSVLEVFSLLSQQSRSQPTHLAVAEHFD